MVLGGLRRSWIAFKCTFTDLDRKHVQNVSIQITGGGFLPPTADHEQYYVQEHIVAALLPSGLEAELQFLRVQGQSGDGRLEPASACVFLSNGFNLREC